MGGGYLRQLDNRLTDQAAEIERGEGRSLEDPLKILKRGKEGKR